MMFIIYRYNSAKQYTMRKRLLAASLGLVAFTCLFQSCKKDTPTDDNTTIVTPTDPDPEPQKWKFIPPSPQRNGDSEAGYDYLVYGDYLDSGIPYDAFVTFAGTGSNSCLLYTSPSPRDATLSRMPSSA